MLQIALWKRLVIWFLCIGGLLLALPNAFYSRVESFNDAKLTSETAEGWPSFLPSSLVNLGLILGTAWQYISFCHLVIGDCSSIT